MRWRLAVTGVAIAAMATACSTPTAGTAEIAPAETVPSTADTAAPIPSNPETNAPTTETASPSAAAVAATPASTSGFPFGAVDWDSGKGTAEAPNPDPSPFGWYEAAFGVPQAAQDKVIYLTFDDGPGAWTPEVLNVLAAHNATATFFLVGSAAANQPDMVESIKSAGHQVGNHTWSHADLTTLSSDAVAAELTDTAALQVDSPCMRPPYGSIDAASGSVAEQLDLQPIMWTAQAYDWKSTATSAQIVADLKARTTPGAVVLLHDGGGDRSATVAALEPLLDYWTGAGYRFAPIPACL